MTLYAGQFFDHADGRRETIMIVRSCGPKILTVETRVMLDRRLVDCVKYTHAGYLAAHERAAEECVA